MSQWFRWHEGTASNPKLAGVARKAKQPRPLVIATWAMLYEDASRSNPRGYFSCETIDLAAALDVDEEDVEAVLEALHERGLIDQDTGQFVPWEEEQRSSDSSAERMRRHRAKKKAQRDSAAPSRDVTGAKNAPQDVTTDVCDDDVTSRDVTGGGVTRIEEKRKEENISPPYSPPSDCDGRTLFSLYDEYRWAMPERPGDTSLSKAQTFFCEKLVGEDGEDPHRIIAAAQAYSREIEANGDGGTKFVKGLLGFLKDDYWRPYADMPPPQTEEDRDRTQWLCKLRAFEANGFWNDFWGPKPGQKGCGAPKDLIDEVFPIGVPEDLAKEA